MISFLVSSLISDRCRLLGLASLLRAGRVYYDKHDTKLDNCMLFIAHCQGSGFASNFDSYHLSLALLIAPSFRAPSATLTYLFRTNFPIHSQEVDNR